MKNYWLERSEDLKTITSAMDEESLRRIADKILNANNVLVTGLGRSRLSIMGFATRLCQMGIRAHVTGDVTTPSLHKGDILIIGSSSGETSTLVSFAKKAVSVDAEIILFTARKESTIASYASEIFVIDSERKDLQKPSGNYCEYGVALAYEALATYLMRKKGLTPDDLKKKLTNLC